MDSYSVLMSVYHRERAQYLKQSIVSMLHQSIRPDDFVIVCDGPLTEELDAVIREFTQSCPDLFQIVRLRENRGLGIALQEGLAVCRHELVARMDSDDISVPGRCEKQLSVFAGKNVAVVGGNIEEFTEEVPDRFFTASCSGSGEMSSGEVFRFAKVRRVPETNEEIRQFARRRNPFNHPSVMFRRSAVQKAGGYKDCRGFEDYYLWVRMLGMGMTGYNLQEILVYMRTDAGMYERRGSLSYALLGLRARWKIHRTGYSGIVDFLVSSGGQIAMSLVPVKLRTYFYGKFLRK